MQRQARALRPSLTRAARRGDANAAAALETLQDDPTLAAEAAAAARRDLSAADQIWEADLARHPAAEGWADAR